MPGSNPSTPTGAGLRAGALPWIAARPSAWAERGGRALGVGVNVLALAAVAAYFAAPMVWLFTSAFRANPSVYVAFEGWTLGNFPRILQEETFLWVRNSLLIALGTTAMTLTTAFLAAYPFARLSFRAKPLLLFALALSMTIPFSAVLLPTYSLARWLGLQNSLLGVALILSARQIPMAIWVLKEFIRAIPVELEEAAWVDGASTGAVLLRILLPLSGPGLAVVGLMSFVGGWGDFATSLILLSREELFPISMGIYKASIEATSWGYVTVDYGVMAAISLLYMAFPAMTFLITHRYLVAGLVIGAVRE